MENIHMPIETPLDKIGSQHGIYNLLIIDHI